MRCCGNSFCYLVGLSHGALLLQYLRGYFPMRFPAGSIQPGGAVPILGGQHLPGLMQPGGAVLSLGCGASCLLGE